MSVASRLLNLVVFLTVGGSASGEMKVAECAPVRMSRSILVFDESYNCCITVNVPDEFKSITAQYFPADCGSKSIVIGRTDAIGAVDKTIGWESRGRGSAQGIYSNNENDAGRYVNSWRTPIILEMYVPFEWLSFLEVGYVRYRPHIWSLLRNNILSGFCEGVRFSDPSLQFCNLISCSNGETFGVCSLFGGSNSQFMGVCTSLFHFGQSTGSCGGIFSSSLRCLSRRSRLFRCVMSVKAGDKDEGDGARCLDPYWCFAELGIALAFAFLGCWLFIFGGANDDLLWRWRYFFWFCSVASVLISWSIVHVALDHQCWFG